MSLFDRLASRNQMQLFKWSVLFPLLFVFIYLYFFMPDRYQSSTIVLVKDSKVVQSESGLLASLGVEASGASEDMKLLQAYVQSKSLALALDEELGLRKHYGESRNFIFGVGEGSSNESFFKFYQKRVRIKREIDTGLLEITAEAFDPEKALAIVNALLVKSERFVNQAGKSIAESEMVFARSEIESSQARLKQAKNALLTFQNTYNLVSPEEEGDSLFSIIFELESELAKTEAEASQAKSYLNMSAPKVKVLEGKASALRKEIEQQKNRVVGGETESDELNALSIDYQSLLLDVELANSLYKSALNAFELARVQAGKQLKHLIIAAKPELSEESRLPDRIYWLITSGLCLVLIFFVCRIVFSILAEHKD